jgi:hypothetical protein
MSFESVLTGHGISLGGTIRAALNGLNVAGDLAEMGKAMADQRFAHED